MALPTQRIGVILSRDSSIVTYGFCFCIPERSMMLSAIGSGTDQPVCAEVAPRFWDAGEKLKHCSSPHGELVEPRGRLAPISRNLLSDRRAREKCGFAKLEQDFCRPCRLPEQASRPRRSCRRRMHTASTWLASRISGHSWRLIPAAQIWNAINRRRARSTFEILSAGHADPHRPSQSPKSNRVKAAR